ncbi:integration host factor, actinobacterial type [Actinomycetota bacterium]
MAPPQLTDAQRQAALAKAAEARRARAELKELLRTGSLSLTDVFERAESDQVVASTKVFAVLISLPGFGKIKAKRLMEDLGIAENRRVRGLGDRQRAKLLEFFS